MVMDFLKSKLSIFIVLLVLLAAHIIQLSPFFLQKLLPFPGDILVGFYFPWNSGGFTGFDPFTQFKAQNTVDVIKQMYPWRDFAFEMIKKGEWPLWNPYSFSGMPLIANLQSAVFFPGHAISLFTSSISGWIFIIVGELLFFSWTSYLFLRSQKISQWASLFGAIVLSNLAYITLWHEQLVISESLLFLPLILLLVNRFAVDRKRINLLFVSFLLTFCVFGGHAQTGIYVFVIYFFFALYKRVGILNIGIFSGLPVIFSAVQLLPSVEAYLLSAREGAITKQLFEPYIFPWKSMVTLVAPDFFGHPTTRNEWFRDYREFSTYIGLTPFIFSVMAVLISKIKKELKFFVFLAVFGLLFSTWPMVFIFDIFNIPILSSGVPARMIFVFQFSLGVLSAYGFEHFQTNLKSKSSTWSIAIVGFFLFSIWVFAVLEKTHFSVTRNNLIIPSAIFICTVVLIFVKRFGWRITNLVLVTLVFLTVFQTAFFVQKFITFSPPKFVFPEHPILSWLQNNGSERFFGGGTASITYDFSVYYRLYDSQGYDSMYPKRYGEFVAAAVDGKIPMIIPRSDAFLNDWQNKFTQRALNLTGTKYLVDKRDQIATNWEPKTDIFENDSVGLLWQNSKWKVYENKFSLPRFQLIGKFEKIHSKEKIIERLYSDNFDYKKVIVLEKDPKDVILPSSHSEIEVLSNTPNEIIVKTMADKPQLLFVSDNFYPGWLATIDGQKTEILRANYTFRAISVPAGSHQIIMRYVPISFVFGLLISLSSWSVSLAIIFYLLFRDKFDQYVKRS